jgi:hypothetical protein
VFGKPIGSFGPNLSIAAFQPASAFSTILCAPLMAADAIILDIQHPDKINPKF